MKKQLFIFACFAMILFLSFPLHSAEWVMDNAGIMGAESKAALEAKIEEIAGAYGFRLFILMEKSIGSSDAIDYSWAFLDSRGLYGDAWDGCLFLLSTSGRDYDFTASGRGEKTLNNAAYNRLEKDVLARLRQDDYAGACNTFISVWEEYLALEAKGRSYNFLRQTQTHLILLAVSWLLAFLIGFLVVRSMKAQMDTAIPGKEADAYIVPGSMALTNQQDRFLYSTVTKTKRQSSSSSGSSRSGGGRSSRSGKY